MILAVDIVSIFGIVLDFGYVFIDIFMHALYFHYLLFVLQLLHNNFSWDK